VDGAIDALLDCASAAFGEIGAGAGRFVGDAAQAFAFSVAERRGAADQRADGERDGAGRERGVLVEIFGAMAGV